MIRSEVVGMDSASRVDKASMRRKLGKLRKLRRPKSPRLHRTVAVVYSARALWQMKPSYRSLPRDMLVEGAEGHCKGHRWTLSEEKAFDGNHSARGVPPNTCLPEKDALQPPPLTFPISASSSIPFWLCHSLVLHNYNYCLIDNAMQRSLLDG